MKAGAVDFFEKPYRGTALMESVRRAIDLDRHYLQTLAEHADLHGRYATLTPEEKEVLQLTVAGKPDKAIAVRLDLSLRTIQLRRASLMRKLGCQSRAELIRNAQIVESNAEN
jgi:FixJ family two-component response regulator